MGLTFPHEDGVYSDAFSCPTDFGVIGEIRGEGPATMLKVVLTSITVSLASSWWKGDNIGRLLLFFTHWLSGLVYQVIKLVMASMVGGCWIKPRDEPAIKILTFFLLTTSNVQTVSNLVICINLALIIKDHRSLNRVRSISSPRRIRLLVLACAAQALLTVPFWNTVHVSVTTLFPVSTHQVGNHLVDVSSFIVDFVVGLCMLAIVSYLVLFRRTELRECYNVHGRIRYHFALTIIAIAADVTIGINGVILIFGGLSERGALFTVAFVMRHAHIALDTLVLYGMLGVSWSSTGPKRVNKLRSMPKNRTGNLTCAIVETDRETMSQ